MKSKSSKSQENQEQSKKKGINYFGHILRATLWFIVLAKKYGWFLTNDPYYQLIYPHLKVYLLSTTIFVLIILMIKKKMFFKALWPIISFYFKFLIFFLIIMYLIFRIVIYILGIISKITTLPRRLEAIVLEIIFFILTAILISTKTNVYVLSVSMTFLMFCIIGLWLSIYSWTTNPFTLFGRLDNLVGKVWNFFIRRDSESKGTNTQAKKKKDIKNKVALYIYCYRFFDWVKNSLLPKVTKTNLLKWFLALYFFILIVTIFGFSFEYYGVSKINSNSLFGIETYVDALYYSALTFITMSFGRIIPNSIISKIFTILEIMLTIYLFVVIILTFTTLTEVAAKKTMKNIGENMQTRKEEGFELINKYLSINQKKLITMKISEVQKRVDSEIAKSP